MHRAEISGLFVYPVKSMKGTALSSAIPFIDFTG